MDAVGLGNPGDCQTASTESTSSVKNGEKSHQQQQQQQHHQNISITTTANAPQPTTISAPQTTKNCSPPPPQSLSNNGNGSGGSNKLKSQQQQQQQQQQQHYQFRAPQQFVKHKKLSAALTNKKNKPWNKRQNKTAKQQQLQQQHNCTSSLANSAAAVLLNCGSVGAAGLIGHASVGMSIGGVGGGVGVGGLSLSTTKADLENIQNLKNHYYHNHYSHNHGLGHGHGHGHGHGRGGGGVGGGNGSGGGCEGRGVSGNGMPISLAGLEKLGYGHGHLKQQLCKKMLALRGHHHHILCAGAAHNTLNIGGNVACCNGGQNGKDGSTGGSNASSNSSSTLHFCCGRSKFFLPDKRPRKEIIIPPTKFLLGGNISDPLNLNSLQNETSNASSNNNTPATTPRRSPITTPPKVEVIIPPNIHDPLHLLDPVDSMEYEKQLTSPMKRILHGHKKSHHHKQHRHRKNRKPKRRRYESQLSMGLDTDDTTSLANSTVSTEGGASTSSLSISGMDSSNMSGSTALALAVETSIGDERTEHIVSPVIVNEDGTEGSNKLLSPQLTGENLNACEVVLRERPNLLELNSASSSTCGSVIGSLGSAAGGGRKRKISESANSQKHKKFHRHDAMDKIVSPVVPQPGAWKRPPRLAATGGRKPVRRSTSISETELLSPVDEAPKTVVAEAEAIHDGTPDLSKKESASEAGLGSPQTAIAAATSVTTGDKEAITTNSVADNLPNSSISTIDTKPVATAAAVTTIAPLIKTPKFSAEGAKYHYGNYNRYAGFRHVNEFMDVRLKVFQRHLELFQDKDILDIGCNVGHMTISVARSLAPKSILGIDIDKDMIARARRNISLYVRIPTEPIAPAIRKSSDIVLKQEEMAILLKANLVVNQLKPERKKRARRKKRQQQKKVTASHVTHHHHHHHGRLHQQLHQRTNRPREPASLTVPTSEAANPTNSSAAQSQNDRGTVRNRREPYQHPHHHHHHHHHHGISFALQQQQKLQKLHLDATNFFPISFPLTYGSIPEVTHNSSKCNTPLGGTTGNTPGHQSAICNMSTSPTATTKPKNDFPRNVFFRQGNYVLKDESLLCNDTQQYDLILCLSVTKWIHLNFGDAGLKLAFKRMFNQLRPGGKLILEAQNWASYKKKKNLTENIYNNYRNIEFFPNKFHEYLLSSEVGFSHSYTLGVPRHLNKGFCRPIQLYAKGDYTPNHVRWSDAYYPQTPFEEYRGIYATLSTPLPLPYYPPSSAGSQSYDTPLHAGSASGPYSCRQTPMHQPTSQYYNPLETDSYLPSYDMEYLNHMYVFASPLYQTVWSPPASLRNSSSHTPVYGSVRDPELDGDGSAGGSSGSYVRHVYPPNDEISSPNANAGGAFNSIRDADTDDSNQLPASDVQHVYLTNCGESSSSPQVNHHDSEIIDGLMLDEESPVGTGATDAGAGVSGDLNEA